MSAPVGKGLITFFYYRDLGRAAEFYQRVMGFRLVQDQRWAKIFRVAENAYLGCVDGSVGYHKPSETKPVMLTVVVDDPDQWYRHLLSHGVKTLSEPHDDKELGLRIFLFQDPEGYVVEIQKFYKPFP
jgi:predicted enzyme related to lactoylglutathione lyase